MRLAHTRARARARARLLFLSPSLSLSLVLSFIFSLVLSLILSPIPSPPFSLTFPLPSLSSLTQGIHSGPLIGGIARRTLLRYRLFGDTVNTTARIKALAVRLAPFLTLPPHHDETHHNKTHDSQNKTHHDQTHYSHTQTHHTQTHDSLQYTTTMAHGTRQSDHTARKTESNEIQVDQGAILVSTTAVDALLHTARTHVVNRVATTSRHTRRQQRAQCRIFSKVSLLPNAVCTKWLWS